MKRSGHRLAHRALQVQHQVSAGGVVFRPADPVPEIVLIRVGPGRWQLPKGLVGDGEAPEEAALRQVREEAGIEAELPAPIETIEYWYVGTDDENRLRFHKRVHFYLMAYRSGDVADHDSEVAEARWMPLGEAAGLLTFKTERAVAEKAGVILAQFSGR